MRHPLILVAVALTLPARAEEAHDTTEQITRLETEVARLATELESFKERLASLEQAQNDTSAQATPAAVLQAFAVRKDFVNSIGQQMIWTPEGTFQMRAGSSKGAPIQLSGFHMGATEVTQKQWQEVMRSDPSKFKGENLPVDLVSWDDAMEFCKKLTERERAADTLPEEYLYTLPTEAQWEYACRAETEGLKTGDLAKVAWYRENSDWEPHPVATRQPNLWGFYDMYGNVEEWCLDWHGSEIPEGENPKGPRRGYLRVYRGGSWFDYAPGTGTRGGERPEESFFRRGFRVAITRDPHSGR